MMNRMLIVGGSRGIGHAVAEHYAPIVSQLYCVSRTQSPFGTWVEADVSHQSGVDAVATALGDGPLDALLYLGGVWEKGAFSAQYDFERSNFDEIDFVMSVNVIAPIKLVKALLANLRASANPRVVMVGSLSALDNTATREVANSASKYGLRGAAQAMQLELGKHGISFTVLNPGNVETVDVLKDIETGAFSPQVPIPMADLISVVDCALKLSNRSRIAEINIAQRWPGKGS